LNLQRDHKYYFLSLPQHSKKKSIDFVVQKTPSNDQSNQRINIQENVNAIRKTPSSDQSNQKINIQENANAIRRTPSSEQPNQKINIQENPTPKGIPQENLIPLQKSASSEQLSQNSQENTKTIHSALSTGKLKANSTTSTPKTTPTTTTSTTQNKILVKPNPLSNSGNNLVQTKPIENPKNETEQGNAKSLIEARKELLEKKKEDKVVAQPGKIITTLSKDKFQKWEASTSPPEIPSWMKKVQEKKKEDKKEETK